MDVAVIDWKDSKFVKDDVLESINAPQWVDFSAPYQSVDDEAWFCRPDCNHPKTVDDFLKKTPPSKGSAKRLVKIVLHKAAKKSFNDRPVLPRFYHLVIDHEDAALKKRGLTQPSVSLNKESKFDRLVEDGENQNPNLSTPPLMNKAKLMKEAIKSSTEKKKQFDDVPLKDETPKLKSTLSARNLFAGKDILNQITDFCSELKRLALRAKEREIVEKENSHVIPVAVKEQEVKECPDSKPRDERKPFLEVTKEKCEALDKSNGREKLRRKKRNDEAENVPIRVDMKSIGRKEDNLAQIRTNPPSPQCFSARRNGVTKAVATPTPLRPKTQGRGILQELEQSNKDVRKEEAVDNKTATPGRMVPLPAEREPAKTLDVFWFLKPCTLAS